MNKKHPKGRKILAGLAVLIALSSAAAVLAYTRDLQQIRSRLASESRIVQTRHGLVEYATWGSGFPILAVHGAGGGYDQGRLLAQSYGSARYQWISVSRFGYLRSQLPANASTDAQAEAFANLLDSIGIEKVAILAMSGGVPPSLQFAAKFPKRTAALVLLSSAPFSPLTAQEQELPIPAWLYQALFGSDFLFWLIMKLSPSGLDAIFDIKPGLRAQMTENDRSFADGLYDAFLPVTGRNAGLRNEAAAIDPAARYDLAAITAPALVVHARDDGINPFAIGQYAAENLAASQFLSLPRGGHLLLGNGEVVRNRIVQFLAEHLDQTNEH